ncbi:hypothetical protein M0813_06631 [Anaeramoeba flamelloides]|uniref:Uncharacterized protein n=1 Tax=Anaeramoeba flamelloides TaxID=1746091 RepID=A0ABQ8XH69_9EUKA|nr:hypothetical protein M0813_06631 [Anaeramoeba flamelloides]
MLQKYHEKIGKVDLVYDEQDPLNRNTIVNLLDLGIKLHFCSLEQRLKLIEASFEFLTVYYQKSVLGSPKREPSFDHILRVIGASFPGNYSQNNDFYVHYYRGLVFVFPIDDESKKLLDQMEEQDPKLLRLKNDLVASHCFIYAGTSFDKAKLPSINEKCEYFQQVDVILEKGIFFSKTSKWIKFGDSTQDVLAEISSPQNIYIKGVNNEIEKNPENEFKDIFELTNNPNVNLNKNKNLTGEESTNKNKISKNHEKEKEKEKEEEIEKEKEKEKTISDDENLDNLRNNQNDQYEFNSDQETDSTSNLEDSGSNQINPDYFFNYFHLGIDIMFDGEEHSVKKIILHTNYPSSIDYNQYERCNYQIKVQSLKKEQCCITPFMKFKEIKGILGQNTRPIVHGGDIIGKEFEKTKFYGFLNTNLIFEIMCKNTYATSVTLFDPKMLDVYQNVEQNSDLESISNEKENEKMSNKKQKNKPRKASQKIDKKLINLNLNGEENEKEKEKEKERGGGEEGETRKEKKKTIVENEEDSFDDNIDPKENIYSPNQKQYQLPEIPILGSETSNNFDSKLTLNLTQTFALNFENESSLTEVSDESSDSASISSLDLN